MKVLVIPDCHLKPYMFDRAAEYMRNGVAEKAVCLMDIADDFNKQFYLELYEETYNRAIDFAKEFNNTLWCYGNHDLSYIWNAGQSGYSVCAESLVKKKLEELENVVPRGALKYIHKIDNVIFCHGGLLEHYVQMFTSSSYDDIEAVIDEINGFNKELMWREESPIWARPQYKEIQLYNAETCLHVVGHTPMERITKKNNLISTDCFSTYTDGTPYGNRKFLLLDTEKWTFEELDCDI